MPKKIFKYGFSILMVLCMMSIFINDTTHPLLAYITIYSNIFRVAIEVILVQKVTNKLNLKYAEELTRKTIHVLLCVVSFPLLWKSFILPHSIHTVFFTISMPIILLILYLTKITDKLKRLENSNIKGIFMFSIALMFSVLIGYFDRRFLYPSLIGILVLGISDTVACFIGKIYGKHKICKGKKSIEGCIGFIISAFIIISCFNIVPWYMALTVAFIGAIVESYSKDYDNLFIPIVTCLLLGLL